MTVYSGINRFVQKLLIPTTLLLLFNSLVTSADERSVATQKYLFDIASKINQRHFFKLVSPKVNVTIKLWKNDKLIRSMQGPPQIIQTEYFSIDFTDEGKYMLEVVPEIDALYHPDDIEVTQIPMTSDQLPYYLVLESVTLHWQQDNSRSFILNQLQQVLTSGRIPPDIQCSLRQTLYAMLVNMGKFQQSLSAASDMLDGYRSEITECTIGKLLLADSNFNLYRFAEAESEFRELTQPDLQLVKQINPELTSYALLKYGFSQILNGASLGDLAKINDGKSTIDSLYLKLDSENRLDLMPEWYNAQATYYSVSSDYISAGQMLNLAIEAKQKLAHPLDIAPYLNNLAMTYLWTGKLAEAQQTMRRSIQLARQQNNFIALATQTANLAATYAYIGDWITAKRYYQRSLELTDMHNPDEGRYKVYLELARISALTHQYDDAITWLLKSEKDSLIRQPEKLALIYARIAEAFQQLNNPEESLKYLDLALQRQTTLSRNKDKADLYISLATYYLNQGQISTSESFLERAERMLEQGTAAQLSYHHLRILTLLANTQIRHETQVQTVRTHFVKAFTFIKNVEQTLDFEKLGPSWMNQVRALMDTYLNYLFLSDSSPNYLAAFDIIEQYQSSVLKRSRAYYNNVNENSGEERQSAWKEKIIAEAAVIDALTESEKQQALEQLDVANEKYQQVRTVKQHPDSTLSIHQIQTRLEEHQALLRYFRTPQTDILFYISKNEWHAETVDLTQWDEWLANNKHAEIFSQIKGESLLPVAWIKKQEINKLVIIPDGNLHLLPFSALSISAENGGEQFLTTEVEIVRTYSASTYFSSVAIDKASGQYDIAIFANPAFDIEYNPAYSRDNIEHLRSWGKSLTPLLWTAKESENIQNIFASRRINLATGTQATSSRLMSKDARYATLLHIATHGYFDPENPEIVGLATSYVDDNPNYTAGFLSLSQLLSQPFHSHLVVISGCETLLGELTASEGLNGLSRGMMAQGAGSVIGTLWSIADKPSAEFMRYFYQQLALSGNSSTALSKAKNKMQRHPRFKHPRYWAGFVLLSSNRQYESIRFSQR
ncbi:CHAT domain-containing protein [Neptunicella sp. SCSIO 80796]|uniref:CHAT domain-containing protein n=1 Tax=Neptunicella plasticusilytica TaxID=3117012 RepID=UPI003A4DAC12